MDPRDGYHSAVHALNIALQARDGLDFAIRATERMWDVVPPKMLTPAEVLLGMLEAAYFEVQNVSCEPGKAKARVESLTSPGNMVLFAVKWPGGAQPYRWAVTTGKSRREVHYAICIQPGDSVPEHINLDIAMTGDILTMPMDDECPTVVATGLSKPIKQQNPN